MGKPSLLQGLLSYLKSPKIEVWDMPHFSCAKSPFVPIRASHLRTGPRIAPTLVSAS